MGTNIGVPTWWCPSNSSLCLSQKGTGLLQLKPVSNWLKMNKEHLVPCLRKGSVGRASSFKMSFLSLTMVCLSGFHQPDTF